MEDSINSMLLKQFEASMCMLWQSITNCPKDEWNEEHKDAPFSQVIFHVLFYTDFYLEKNDNTIKNQEYHMKHKEMFKDYEELEAKKAINTYTKTEIDDYFGFCLKKGCEVISSEDSKSFYGDSGISFRKCSRLELYIYLIRHIQHHAAQLGLRVQQITGKELQWVGAGWKDLK
jgi:hypothetical protein